MNFQKLETPSLKELFITELETKILSGELPIGTKLPSERELAASMQVLSLIHISEPTRPY